MADEKKNDIYALEKENGSPAYPKMIYRETGEKHKDGSPVTELVGKAANPDEHKKMLAESNAVPAWAGSSKSK